MIVRSVVILITSSITHLNDSILRAQIAIWGIVQSFRSYFVMGQNQSGPLQNKKKFNIGMHPKPINRIHDMWVLRSLSGLCKFSMNKVLKVWRRGSLLARTQNGDDNLGRK